MDPNKALESMRAAIADMQLAASNDDSDAYEAAAYDVVESANALDEWLSRGRFLPDAWKGQTYSRPEIVNGTGWTRDARFRQV